MFLGTNLQYLRKTNGNMTQERLAERMGVSRQTVSKWESGDGCPELSKLVELCDVFSCKLDALLREDMAARDTIYSPVRILRVKGFRMARYVMISPQPEDDVNAYMDAWAQRSGLLDIPGPAPVRIGWDFPYVSQEQKSRFGLRGYAAAYLLPEGFEPVCGGAEIVSQPETNYAVMTVRDPFAAAFDRIPQAYQRILEYLSHSGIPKSAESGFLPCFEWVCTRDGVTCMDVFIHCGSTGQAVEYQLGQVE
ncbi:MAG: helix-turn-helix transcriptional regulator [Candidatus Faecousia sp.]|nr:helix-turn-helix transcriptional regulator [Candidatus Faecousia sp.]